MIIHKFSQGDRIKVVTDDKVMRGEFHRYGETRHGAIVFFDELPGLSFVDEESLLPDDDDTGNTFK